MTYRASRRLMPFVAVCLLPIGCGAADGDPLESTPPEAALDKPDHEATDSEQAISSSILRSREAKRRMADDPAGPPALERLLGRRAALELTEDHSFGVHRVTADDAGSKHVRLAHTYQGIRVLRSTAIAHVRPSGDIEEDTHALKRIRPMQTVPRVSVAQAERAVAARPEHVNDYVVEPLTELCIDPIEERFVKATGAKVTGEEEDLNALDVERRVVGQRLVYQVDTVERGVRAPLTANRFIVDAESGEVVRIEPLDKHAIGIGNTFNNAGPVTIFTEQVTEGVDVYYRPRSVTRKFGVYDHDACENFGTIFQNCDRETNRLYGTNVWGDSARFMGDSLASDDNRRTAIADVLFGMQVTWDMFSHVWNRQGYNDDYLEGNAYVHSQTNWDNAMYNSVNDQIFVGDGPSDGYSRRNGIDTIGHEFGHGVEDHTANMGNGGETGGISEGHADIIGEIAEAYALGGGQTSGSTTIPVVSSLDWVNSGSNRNFKTGSGIPYWSSGLADLSDEHDRAKPLIHAFYFLSQGASSDPVAPTFSVHTPWGMAGVGIDSAARIWVRALIAHMSGDTTYADARIASLAAANELFLPGSSQHKAVENAFGAINVGSVTSNYLPDPEVETESEPNDSFDGSNPVMPVAIPSGAPLQGSLWKRIIVIGAVTSANKEDFFSVIVPAGRTLRVTILNTNDNDLYLYDADDVQIDKSALAQNKPDQVTSPSPDGSLHVYRFKVRHYNNLNVIPMYQAYVDLL